MNKIRQNFRRFLQDFYLVLIMLFLYAPIATMVVLSFNSSKSRTQWGGFTLQWYTQMFASRNIMAALQNTLLIAFLSALIATIIGTAASIAISSSRFLFGQIYTFYINRIVDKIVFLGVQNRQK